MPSVAEHQYASGDGIDPTPLVEDSRRELTRRIYLLTDREAQVPPVEELVKIEGAKDARGLRVAPRSYVRSAVASAAT